MKKINKKGFTLIELLAVIAIIAIIGAIATPNVIKLINSSNQDQIMSDAKLAISKAKYQFRVDMDENSGGMTYDIKDLIESETEYSTDSKVQVSLSNNKYIYSIYISNGKYCIGTSSSFELEEEILNKGKGVISDSCTN